MLTENQGRTSLLTAMAQTPPEALAFFEAREKGLQEEIQALQKESANLRREISMGGRPLHVVAVFFFVFSLLLGFVFLTRVPGPVDASLLAAMGAGVAGTLCAEVLGLYLLLAS